MIVRGLNPNYILDKAGSHYQIERPDRRARSLFLRQKSNQSLTKALIYVLDPELKGC